MLLEEYLIHIYPLIHMSNQKKDTHSYKGWLNSDNFVKRCFATLGYQTVAVLIIYGVMLGLMLLAGVFALVVGGIS